ncbi:hypothetical protein HPB52_012783 [Rhipicephalus sanguineus]|uniref:Nose resistant-to-fluoxetine protein N-terminal domain-containing protein n=1 Tax=Rhipicephalus sanguineus TaxID=34632 RepID=A0A9D4PVX5_RHISA|nr:hypothetical protein HPB52_012783 [Rhipicephalus sanguineus]
MLKGPFLDATGKFPSGILEGTTGDLGAYDECLASRLEPASEVKSSLSSRGQYCSVFLKPKQSRAMDKLISQLTRYPVIKKRFNLTMARKAIRKGRVRGLRFGLCVPSSCSAAEVESILGSRVWTVAWKAFSAAKNTESLLKETPPEHESLKCLNGLRFFTALWVILGHSYNILDPHILGESTCKPLTVPTALLLGSVFLLPLVVRGPAADQWLPGKVVNCYQSWPAVILHYNNWLTHVRIVGALFFKPSHGGTRACARSGTTSTFQAGLGKDPLQL